MDLPQTAQLLLEIEQRQDEVLRGLEDLNACIETTVAQYQGQLKILVLESGAN